MVRSASLRPRNFNRVAQRLVIHRMPVNLQHAEMYLVNVEHVRFARSIFDSPVFDRPAPQHDVRFLSHAEGLWSLSFHGDEKVNRRVEVRTLPFFRKVKRSFNRRFRFLGLIGLWWYANCLSESVEFGRTVAWHYLD